MEEKLSYGKLAKNNGRKVYSFWQQNMIKMKDKQNKCHRKPEMVFFSAIIYNNQQQNRFSNINSVILCISRI